MSPSDPLPLLRDVIVVPEPSATSDSDFVLMLADGVTDAERTLRDYVIPDRLVANFDQALGLISTAMSTATPRRLTCTARSDPANRTSWPSCTPCCAANARPATHRVRPAPGPP